MLNNTKEEQMKVASLNRKRLKVKPGKDYAELLLMGDTHFGSNNCDLESFQANLDYCLEKKVYVLLMGDMLEAATRYSIGSGVYHQMNPQEAVEYFIEQMRPLAEAGLILGYVSGN